MYKIYTGESGIHTPFYQKILLIMRLTIVLLIAAIMQVSASGFAQKITFSKENTSLKLLFEAIKKQTGYNVVLSSKELLEAKPISVSFHRTPLEEVLSTSLSGQSLAYTIEKKTIVISRTEPSILEQLMTHFSNIDATGRVVDATGQPLPGVTVQIKNGNKVAITDAQGYFVLKNVDEHAVLTISLVGYGKREVNVAANMGNISLSVSISKLDEVQVIGYGTTTKRFNTGSVVTIKAEDIKNQVATSPLQALGGMVPGLFIQQGNGMPGAASKVLIRGTNSLTSGTVPLYIIDGVPFDGNPVDQGGGAYGANQPNGETDPLNSINPNDIESIDVLKDADATSIYGSRGANGVIIITTKRAVSGKTTVSGSVYTGFSKVSKFMPVLSTSEYLAIREQAFANDNVTPTIANAPDLKVWDKNANTDYEKFLLGNTAHVTDANLSIGGGDVRNGFLLSGAYRRETTVIPGDFSYHRGSLHAKAYHTSADGKLNAEFSAIYSNDYNKLPSSDLTNLATTYPNNYPLYNPNGSLYFNNNFAYNPISLLRNYYKTQTNNLILNASISYNILPNLKFKLNVGDNVISLTSLSINPISASNPADVTGAGGFASYSNNVTTTYLAEPQIDYNTVIGKGKLAATIGGSYQYRDFKQPYFILGANFASDALIENFSSAGLLYQTLAYSSLYKYASVFGRVNYNWDSKYILSGTFRRDGSSKFGPSKQYGNFGSAGAAWLFSEESFMKDQKWLSFGKLRGSYGTVGNDQIQNYSYLDSYSTSFTPYGTSTGTVPSRIANPDFRWESTKKLEAALELGFFDNNLLLNASWFRNRTSNLLVSYPISGQTGFTAYTANFDGVVQNTGWEFEIKATPVTTKSVRWNIGFNISTAKNKLVSFPGLSSSDNYSNKYVIGEPLNLMTLYNFTGFVNGVAQVKDENNDGRITPGLNANGKGDYIVAGTTDPKFYGGFNSNFKYKNFQLDVFLNFVKQMGYAPTAFPGLITNQFKDVLDGQFKPSISTGSDAYVSYANYYVNSTARVQDASFIRLRNVTLSYNLSPQWQKAIGMTNCRLFITGQNLFTLTHYKGFDPETTVYNPIGFPTPPPAPVFPPLRTITGGVQFSF